MKKSRYPFSSDRQLRLQEVGLERRIRLPGRPGPKYPYRAERLDTEENTVAALAWPHQTSWRHH